MAHTYLGIDIGTSGCKLALFDDAGALLYAASEVYPTHYPAPGEVEQEPEDWWRAVCRGLNRLWEQGAGPASVAAIGIDGQSWSAVPVDAEGTVLARTPIWMDTRAARVAAKWSERLTPERIFAVSGNPFSPTYTLPKVLYWMEREPEFIKRAWHILQSNSFIVYRLTGAVSMDFSMAYGWHNFNQRTLKYDTALTREFGVPERFLTEPVPSHTVIGRVTAGSARLTGLLAGTPVVAGGLDAACGTFGAGVTEPGQTQEQGGQAGGMSICLDTPLSHEKLILSPHVIPDRWLLQGGSVGGGASLKWFAEQLGAVQPGGETAIERSVGGIFKLLDAEAESSTVGAGGVVFLPYFAGERSPLWDTKACGMYFGLKFSTAHADLVRATMEGAAFALRHNIETALETGASIKELRATGGSANSRIWTQIKADVTNTSISVPDADDATARGAAMLAMLGVGCYPDARSAADAIVRVSRVQEPTENTPKYGAYYGIYKSLYTCTADCMSRLYDIETEG